jgi:hypothetical protein
VLGRGELEGGGVNVGEGGVGRRRREGEGWVRGGCYLGGGGGCVGRRCGEGR